MTNIDGVGRVSPDNYAARGHETARRVAHRLVHDGEIMVDVTPEAVGPGARVRHWATAARRALWTHIWPRWSPCAHGLVRVLAGYV
jgi:hypothetical protein